MTGEQGTTSFMAPELLLPVRFGLDRGVPSPEADIYALGMTVYQVLTGRCPFYPRKEGEIMFAVISGERPRKPENAEEIGMMEVVWGLLKECWKDDRMARPTIAEVHRRFREITSENEITDSVLEEFVPPRLDAGNPNSVVSQSSSLTTAQCELSYLCLLSKLFSGD